MKYGGGFGGQRADFFINTKWDKYFMTMAREAGKNSKCLSRHIGSVLVRPGEHYQTDGSSKSVLFPPRLVSTGYNGPPVKIPTCDTRNPNRENLCPRYVQGYKSGEGLHLCVAGHAERNAILNAAFLGIPTEGTILYCDCGVPCTPCIIEIINAGILEVIWNTMGSPTGSGGSPYYDETSKYLVENTHVKFRSIDMP